MTDIVYEHRPHPKRSGQVSLVSRERAYELGGFISIHGFIPPVADLIRSRRGTYGLDKVPLYLDRVILDFDDADSDYDKALAKCIAEGYEFKAYHTGNRGYHIHIMIVPGCEVGIYRRAAAWAEANFSGYDKSMYKPTGITRIPGTYHSKTGKRMELVSSGGSLKPDIRKVRLHMPTPVLTSYDDESEWDLEGDFAVMLRRKISEGGRNSFAYRLFARGLEIGVDVDDLWSLITRWNTTCCDPPITERELRQTLKSAQRKRRYK